MTRLVQSFKRLFQLFVGHISHICLNLNLLVICPTFISRYFVLESVIRGQCSPTHLFWSWRVFFWFWVFVLVSSVVLPSFKTNWFYKSSFSCLRRGKLVDSNSKNELLLYNAPFSFGRVFVRLEFSIFTLFQPRFETFSFSNFECPKACSNLPFLVRVDDGEQKLTLLLGKSTVE